MGTVAGAGASRILLSRYQVQTTIWIQSSEPRGSDRGPIGANQLLAASAWGDLLKSYVVLEAVVRERRLYLSAKPSDQAALATFAVAEQYRPGQYRLRVDKAGQTYRIDAGPGAGPEHGNVGGAGGRPPGVDRTPG